MWRRAGWRVSEIRRFTLSIATLAAILAGMGHPMKTVIVTWLISSLLLGAIYSLWMCGYARWHRRHGASLAGSPGAGPGAGARSADQNLAVPRGLTDPPRRAPTEWHLQTLYRWDGESVLTILGNPSWRVESLRLEVLASLLLYHLTDDRVLADDRAKAFADEILRPLAGAPASILSGAVEAWLGSPQRVLQQRARERTVAWPVMVRCSGCRTPMAVHPRHVAFLEVFGTRCDGCRRVPA